ncbi:MAG: hypothetical protein QXT64_02270 [Desulfurococcaceae archaeon]
MGVMEFKRCLWGPYDGGVIPLPDGRWMFIHADGTPIIIASSLTELWEILKEQGLVSIKEIICFMLTKHYICDCDIDDSIDPQIKELAERIPPEKVMILQREPDEPVITMAEVPFPMLLEFLQGRRTLKEIAKVVQ